MADVQQACATCIFVRAHDGWGYCRRLPPKMTGEVLNLASAPSELTWAVWPQVNLDNDWCGEWEPTLQPKAREE